MKVYLCWSEYDDGDGWNFDDVKKVIATEEKAWAWLRELSEPIEVSSPYFENKRIGIERYKSRQHNQDDGSYDARYIRVHEVEE